MEAEANPSDEVTFRLACQRVVGGLIEKYAWVWPQEADLVGRILDSIQLEVSPVVLERLAYSVALYETCRQAQDPARREGGYAELAHFLSRAAYNRWPDLAEDATQRALLLVYQQLDRCQSPATFLAFALNKLRQAFKEEQRARDKKVGELSLNGSLAEEIGQANPTKNEATFPLELNREECLSALVKAIARLPNSRQQKAILWKFFGGLSDHEIAARLEVTAANVRKLRHDGLARLRQDEGLRNRFVL